MFEAVISVLPVDGGWAVQPHLGERTFFLHGGQAEAHARALGQAVWRTGTPALILVHDRGGRLAGRCAFGLAAARPSSLDAVPPASSRLRRAAV